MKTNYEVRKDANKRYLAKFDEIRVRVPKGTKEKYKSQASAVGKSLNQYIVDLLDSDADSAMIDN